MIRLWLTQWSLIWRKIMLRESSNSPWFTRKLQSSWTSHDFTTNFILCQSLYIINIYLTKNKYLNISKQQPSFLHNLFNLVKPNRIKSMPISPKKSNKMFLIITNTQYPVLINNIISCKVLRCYSLSSNKLHWSEFPVNIVPVDSESYTLYFVSNWDEVLSVKWSVADYGEIVFNDAVT